MSEVQTPGMRTREMEEPTNLYLIHPLSRICVGYFIRWGVHPNVISLAGLGFGVAAAFAYHNYQSWPLTLVGLLLMLAWHVMDGSDGQLARLTGKTSEIGRVLDGVCDHGTFALIYLSLVLALTPQMGITIWFVAAVAGASHMIQASTYELQRQSFDFWVHGKGAFPHSSINKEMLTADGRRIARIFSTLNRWYLSVQTWFTSVDQGGLSALRGLSASAADRDRIGRLYSAAHLPTLRKWNLLSSNYRTLAIFMSCLIGYPIAYFLFEIFLLNAVLAVLILQTRKNHQWFRALVGQSSPVARAA